MAQISNRTGFVMQGDTAAEAAINTGTAWKATIDAAYSPLAWRDIDQRLLYQYYVAGGTERVDGARYPWGWESASFNDSAWAAAQAVTVAMPLGVESHEKWQLMPSPVPMVTETPQRFARVARVEGITVPGGFLAGSAALTIPPHAHANLLLDQQAMTTGYPVLVTSAGRGAQVRITYSEALYGDNRNKGDRNQVEGKKASGLYDEFLPDGGSHRVFRPLWTRSWRYVELQLDAGDEPLTVDDIRSEQTNYPAARTAHFESGRPSVQNIWDVGWRTLQLSAQDVFISDLYWERIQYVGDTKLQALAWLTATGDEKLYRQALEQFDASRAPFGLTQSRFPAELEQYTPLYSLAWITMVHDFWRYRRDDAYLRQFLPGIQQVLSWYERQQTADGLIPPLFQLDFVDSNYDERAIVTAEGAPGMAPHSLFYVMALDDAADLFAYLGRTVESREYRAKAVSVREAVHRLCWDQGRQLLADTPSKHFFSQQANILAILTDAVPAADQPALLDRLLQDQSIAQMQMYFRYYLGRAFAKANRGDRYLDNLGPWERMIAQGMTTFGEMDGNPRSECHPWSATPVYELMATVAGIQPASPGFQTVRIAPSLGNLTTLKASMPHPAGMIEVTLERSGPAGLKATVHLPPGLRGTFVWGGKSVSIEGNRELTF